MTARSSPWACAPSSAIASSSPTARAGSLATSTSAARACSRMENNRWETASCSSRASLARSSRTDTSRLRSYSRALVRAIAACAANSVSSSSSSAVNSPVRLLATKMMPRTSSPFFTGTPRKAVSSGWAAGHHPPNRGSCLMSASRSGAPAVSSAASMPCWRGSGPIARCWAWRHPVDHELAE